MDKLPEEVKLIRNSIDSVHGDITSVGESCAILEELRDADKVVHDIKMQILGLHAVQQFKRGHTIG